MAQLLAEREKAHDNEIEGIKRIKEESYKTIVDLTEPGNEIVKVSFTQGERRQTTVKRKAEEIRLSLSRFVLFQIVQ